MSEWMRRWGIIDVYLFKFWLSRIQSWQGTVTIKTFSPLRNVPLCAFLGNGKQMRPNSLYLHYGSFKDRLLTSSWPIRQSLVALGIE